MGVASTSGRGLAPLSSPKPGRGLLGAAARRQRLAAASQPGRRPAPAPPLLRTSAAATASASYDSDSDFDLYSFITPGGVVDYYTLLGIDDAAPAAEVKAAYRALAKVCHPDFAGEEGHNMCILLNEAYTVLMDPAQRSAYNAALDAALEDEVDGFTGRPLSRWMANTTMGKNTDPAESRAVLVSETDCIGCRHCAYIAPATFRIEPEYGRARAFGQWLDVEDDIKAAMDACPVSCIHWVEKEDLPALEFVMQFKMGTRTGVGLMMGGQGGAVMDVWTATANYLKERSRKEEERQRAARYSKAQDAARRKAAAGMAQRQQGWFTSVADSLGLSGAAAAAAAAMEEAVYGSPSYGSSGEEEYGAYRRVGRRQRAAARRPGSGSRGQEGGKVLADRALVPVAAARRVWER